MIRKPFWLAFYRTIEGKVLCTLTRRTQAFFQFRFNRVSFVQQQQQPQCVKCQRKVGDKIDTMGEERTCKHRTIVVEKIKIYVCDFL